MTMSSSTMPLSTAQGLSGHREGGTATVPAVTTHREDFNMGLGIWRQGNERKRQWNVLLELLALLDIGDTVPGVDSSVSGLGQSREGKLSRAGKPGQLYKEAWPAVPSVKHKILAISHDLSFDRADAPTKKSPSLDPRKDGNVSLWILL